jgi:alkyl sulfatase BDS1-like metallo-beta-lactamase superfamily hydrolase
MTVISQESLAAAGLALVLSLFAVPIYADPPESSDQALNWADKRDEDFASRGLLATRADPLIKDDTGRVVYNLDDEAFIDVATPAQINPSLLRQMRLFRHAGLFEVVEGVYQVRGFDVTNITFIRGKTGWIVIDPLLTPATAAAAYQLVSERVGKRPIKAVIYTHSHVDHFGGVKGIVSQDDVDAGRVQVIAPQGFLAATLKEFVVNGNATQRRTDYAGVAIPHRADGNVGVGLSAGSAFGPMSLIAPTVSITHTGEERIVDGVHLIFQMTPGTEAPAEMNIYLPQFRVLDMAENANVTMHNVLSPRGVEVRDAKGWADDISEAIHLFGEGTDAVMISHGWPRFGHGEAIDYLSKQRDAYKYLHDQTVRMMNDGLLPAEIANRLRLPDALEREWYNHGYYGSLSFNARAVYQRYLGWYDGNPVHLQPFEPRDEAQRYVAAMGGRASTYRQAQDAVAKGDDRWASELLNRLVMADATDQEARNLLAATYDRLGRAQENGIWRNQYLSAALELRAGIPPRGMGTLANNPVLAGIPTTDLFEMMAVRLDPAKVGTQATAIDFILTDTKERVRVTVRNDVLTFEPNPAGGTVDATVTMTKLQLLKLLTSAALDPAASVAGPPDSITRFAGWFTAPVGRFPIVWRP